MEEKSIINRLLGLVRLHDDKVKKNTPDAWSTEGIASFSFYMFICLIEF